MKVAITFFFGIISIKFISGFSFSEDLKFCVYAGNFDVVTLSGDIKKRSEKMMFSVVLDFEQLSNFLTSLPSKTIIVTSYKISLLNLIFLKEEGICDNMIGKNVFDKTECYHYQLMDILGQKLNFTKRTVDLKDKRYPYIFPNGSHSGLFRMVSDYNVDVSCGSFVITGKRMDEYKFLWPTFFLETMMYLKRDEKRSSWSNFFKPFGKDVWIAIVLYLTLSSFVRYLLHRFHFFASTEATLYNSFLLSFQILCGQGVNDVPNGLSIRLIHFLSLLAVIILNPAYSGSVLSFLTLNVPHLPFNDFEGFKANEKYSLLTSEGDFMTYYLYFEMGDFFKGKRKYLLVGLKNLAGNAKDGMQQICNGEPLTYVDSRQNLADLMNGWECNIVELPQHIFIQHTGMIVDENLPCRDSLASGLRYLRSTGILQKMQSDMIPALAFARLKTVKGGPRSLSIAEIYPCLVLQASGLFIAISIFLIKLFFGERYHEPENSRRRLHHRSFIEITCEISSSVDTLMM